MPTPRRIVVIKHGALGDIALCFGPFAAIRRHHPHAEITLLTTAAYADWLRPAPWFDAAIVDPRPAWWNLPGLMALSRRLRGADLVYDLQTSGRSTRYFWLAGCPAWSGIGWFRRYPDRDPGRNHQHSWERQRGQLRQAGISLVPIVRDLGFLQTPPPEVPRPYGVLIPGAAPHRPEKRWPARHFAALARHLAARGLTPVVAGTKAESPLAATIGAIDLTGRTSLPQLAGLLAGATVVIGNDTGPMHLAAACGTRCITLFGPASDPDLTAPRMADGAPAQVLRATSLADLAPDQVAALLG